MTRYLLTSLVIALGLIGLSTGPALSKDGVVYTVNYPLQYFAEAIGDQDVEVVFPAPPDIDPAEWTPDVDTLLAFQTADLVLLNGAGYARWTKGAYLARSRLVDTSASFTDRLIAEESDAVPHVHGPTGEEEGGDTVAFTTWLDLSLARAQARAVLDAMVRRWPKHASGFAERHAGLDAALAALDSALSAALGTLRGRHVVASHPVYQYLARRYGLDLTSMHWEPDLTPPPEAWAALDTLLSQHAATVMLWEGEPTPETRRELERRGLQIAIVPTVSNRPTSGDFVSSMNATITALRESLTK